MDNICCLLLQNRAVERPIGQTYRSEGKASAADSSKSSSDVVRLPGSVDEQIPELGAALQFPFVTSHRVCVDW